MQKGRIEVQAPPSVLPFQIIVTLPDDGHNYWPKHVVVNMMDK